MARILRPPQRFTPDEWMLSNAYKYRHADLTRVGAQALQNEVDVLMEETSRRTQKTLEDVNQKLDQRISDVKYWKSEVNKKLDDLTKETHALDESLSRLRKAYEATQEPLHISQQCVQTRLDRKGVDLVHDNLQIELCQECEVIKGVQQVLHRVMEQAQEQLRLNRKAIYDLKRDAADKLAAQKIDEYARSLKETDESLPGLQGSIKILASSTTDEEWQNFTDHNIIKGDKQLHNSQKFRSIINGVLQQVASDQRRQVELTNHALETRVSETRSVKGKLEEHLALVLKEISKVEDTILDIQKAINDKEGALRLAGTRLDVRGTRPNIELCRDSATYRLIQEVAEITNDVARLRDRLHAAETSLKALCRRQLDLEEEIQIKAATLFIDDVQCRGMRESLKINAY